MRPMLIRSVTAVNILMLKQVLFILERDIIIRLLVDLFHVILSLEEILIR